MAWQQHNYAGVERNEGGVEVDRSEGAEVSAKSSVDARPSWIVGLGAALFELLDGVFMLALIVGVAGGVGVGVGYLIVRMPAQLLDGLENIGGVILPLIGVAPGILLGGALALVVVIGAVQAVGRGFRERRQRPIIAGPIAYTALVILHSFGAVVGALFLSVLAAAVVCVITLYLS